MRAVHLFVLLPALLTVAGCRPGPPSEFGVHVTRAGNDSARVAFQVTPVGTLELGVRAPSMAETPQKALLISTPADLIVNKGTGWALVAAVDSTDTLMVTPLNRADSAQATASGPAVRIARVQDTRHIVATRTVNAIPPTIKHP